MSYNSKYTGQQVETLLDQVSSGSGIKTEANVKAVETTEGSLDDVQTATYVKYTPQSLTVEQKQQARNNIGVQDINTSQFATNNSVDEKIDNLQTVYAKLSDLDNKLNKIQVIRHPLNETQVTLDPNVIHAWYDEVSDLDIEFAGNNMSDFYSIMFISGGTPTTLSLPLEIIWQTVPNIQANTIYEINITNGLGIIIGYPYD